MAIAQELLNLVHEPTCATLTLMFIIYPQLRQLIQRQRPGEVLYLRSTHGLAFHN